MAAPQSNPAITPIVVPNPTRKRFYGKGLPGIDLDSLTGALVVVEGADGSGRSTQIKRLAQWLEASGHATVSVGLKRSGLISEELDHAMEGKLVSARTMSLFYATDFADQLETRILPALRSGSIVLADRYIYTLIARGLVRGLEEEWLHNLYGVALVPDAVFYLRVSPEELIQRTFAKQFELDYWESGMDFTGNRDMFESFLDYQTLIQEQFEHLKGIYGFTILNGHRPVEVLRAQLQRKIEGVLKGRKSTLTLPPTA